MSFLSPIFFLQPVFLICKNGTLKKADSILPLADPLTITVLNNSHGQWVFSFTSLPVPHAARSDSVARSRSGQRRRRGLSQAGFFLVYERSVRNSVAVSGVVSVDSEKESSLR